MNRGGASWQGEFISVPVKEPCKGKKKGVSRYLLREGSPPEKIGLGIGGEALILYEKGKPGERNTYLFKKLRLRNNRTGR